MTTRLPRVVAVGFNKCATRSLAKLFERAGHASVHQKLPRTLSVGLRKPRKLGRIMRLNVEAGRPVFAGFDNYLFYGDLIDSNQTESFDGNQYFRQILNDYPDTILLLNTRHREGWIRSRLNHGHGEFAAREQRIRGLDSLDQLCEQWRVEWDRHLSAVRTFMADRPAQLVEFHLDEDCIEDLVHRLPAYGLRPEHFSDIGRSRDLRTRAWLMQVKRWWSHRRPRAQK